MILSRREIFGFGGFIASLILISFSIEAFAQSDKETRTDLEFTVVTGEELKKNPMAIKILENIEIAKKRFAEMQDLQKQKTEREKFIDGQRNIAKMQLERDLAKMNKDYEDYTPRNAFAKFTSTVKDTHHAIFWDQFDYMNEKIRIATHAKNLILQNGGSDEAARDAFMKFASMQRTEMIKYVSELNIKHGFTDEYLQSYFDGNGKLPRFEVDEDAPCYACEKYQAIKDDIIAEHERVKQNSS